MLPSGRLKHPVGVGLMTCYKHPSMGAAARCANCGKEICAACVTHVGSKTVCRDCADVLRSQPGLAAGEPQPEARALADPGPTELSIPEAATVPATVAPASIAPAVRSYPPAVPDAGSGGPREKESLLSAALSLLLPGAGQLYNGQAIKGLVLAALYIGSIALIMGGMIVAALSANYNGAARSACCCCLPLFILPLIVLVYAIYDAYETAEKINNHEAVRDWL